MRLGTIQEVKRTHANAIQELPGDNVSTGEFGEISSEDLILAHESFKRRAIQLFALSILKVQQRAIARKARFTPPFSWNLFSLEERFSTEASLAVLLATCELDERSRVLVPGCGSGKDDVQSWLHRGIKDLEGCDIYNLDRLWKTSLPALRKHFGATINFRQASLENLPYPKETFDLVASSAVLEHVRNFRLAVKEMARVLRPGGWAWHSFGPLYFSHGGDHCISCYGFEHGYDHLLLESADYDHLVQDRSFFDTQADPNCNYWARHAQFSFLTPQEYISIFSEYFEIKHVLVKLSLDGLRYRQTYPQKWLALTKAGCSEASLLIKGLNVVLRKR
jgi:SAM-dependent methyltransferase